MGIMLGLMIYLEDAVLIGKCMYLLDFIQAEDS